MQPENGHSEGNPDPWFGYLTLDEIALAVVMSDASEDAYCAGWMGGCEVALWDLLHGRRERWGMANREHLAPRLLAIKALSDACGSWIEHDDEKQHLVAVPLAEWKERMHTGHSEPTVKCARRWCRKRLRLNPIFGGEGKQWCSQEHRDGRDGRDRAYLLTCAVLLAAAACLIGSELAHGWG